MNNRSRSMSEFDVYFSTSSTVARYGLQDGSFGVLPVNSSEGPGPAGSLAVKSPVVKFGHRRGREEQCDCKEVQLAKQGKLSNEDRLDTGDASRQLVMTSTMRLPSRFRCL